MLHKHRIAAALLLAALTIPRAARADVPALTLPEALARARGTMAEFARGSERRLKAELLWSRALAALQPALVASATLTLARPIDSALGRIRSLDGESGSATLSLGLFDGSAFAKASAALAARDAERASATRDEEEARLAVVQAYYAALAADALEAVAARAVESAEAHRADAEARLEGGAALPLDVTRAKLEVTRARSDVVLRRADAADARALLALLCGIDGDVAVVRPAAPALPAADPDALARRAEDARPDLHAADAVVTATRRNRSAARWALAPTLALTGSATIIADPTLFSPNPDYSMSLKVSWTIYDGGARWADIREEEAALHSAETAARELRARVRVEVRNALRDLEASTSSLTSLAEEVDLARKTLDMAEARYRAGAGSGLEVVEASQSVRTSEASLVRAELDHELKAVSLLRALGDDLSALERP